ncbi:MAG: YceH family protein [Thermoanaerobaculales bacterium]|nr:YceH family protein [Thermoanaerobaculales bacterium]
MSLPRELDPVEIRVLGCLLEKERTTPDAYPLSLNSLVAASNQKSNRDPVMTLSESDVRAALDRLHEEVLVWPVAGARIEKWRHSLERRLNLGSETGALLTLLLLRGPQTAGELRARAERMHHFSNTSEIETILVSWAQGDEALTVHLERRPGQKESRWMHLVGGQPIESEAPFIAASPRSAATSGLSDRVTELEERVAALEELIEKNFQV